MISCFNAGLAAGVLALGGLMPAIAQATSAHDEIAAYLDPYVRSNNFSGSILVVKSGRVLFRNSYGPSGLPDGAPNSVNTRFHVASLSMQFTAAAVMRLVEQGKLSLDTKVSELVADVPNGEKITVRELLQSNSGLPDANDMPGYDDLLNAHQTPESLVQFIRGQPPRFEPGGESQGEEHSAYNLLALIAERVSGLPFKEVVRHEVFAPLRMRDSGIDDDSPIAGRVALGHVENGAVALQAAPRFHWSAKTGNGSAYSTVDDERRWLEGFLGNRFLSAAHRQTMLNCCDNGYGWEQIDDPRFHERYYFMNGEAPGFASTIIYMPRLHAEIVILSNLKITVPRAIAFDLAAMLEGVEYQRLELRAAPLTTDEMSHVLGNYTFGADFYRSNATLQLAAGAAGLILRWPGGPNSPVLVVDDHHFIDRHYWARFSVTDDQNGEASQMTFGRFLGQRSSDSSRAPTH